MKKKDLILISSAKKILWLYLCTFLGLFFFILISLKTKIPIEIFLKDPALVAGSNGLINSGLNFSINPLVGAVSNIGILLWCISATISFLGFLILKKNGKKNESGSFLFYSGILTSTLLVDDLFLVHEAIAPKLLKINQEIVYLFLGIATALWLLKFRKTILRTDYIPLVLAFIFFGLSIVFDRIIDWSAINLASFQIEIFEDGSKLFGIVSWMAYFFNVFFREIDSLLLSCSNRTSAKVGLV
ncbi:hypothetical protein [Merismopedia glauca]|uniref:DUF998 domain-containing protein n=1 Tax=Merismopedia glauca CCAP 1448/3 TaxID=1296344 RepID=A0A2T1BX56_9CYAN|nr:hypothetical protein [Merismopedia glauca]PSB00590.1 hypothetical protein C7B64_22725 [Merismopedia glauca CCAP 1448/3]